MIIELLLNLIYGATSLILTPISIVFSPIGNIAGIIELFALGSIFVPISTLGTCLGIWLAFQFVRFTMSVVNWLIAKIPTID